MSEICSCGVRKYPNLNRPNCVIEMKAIAFPILVPRYKADGVTRNTIDTSSLTIGDDIRDMLSVSNETSERIYPFPRCENVDPNERTETVYETAPSTRKYKIEGVGGVRTFKFELWAKDAVNQILRELKKVGCEEVDFFLVDVAGQLWGIKDDINDDLMRGFEMSTETFDAFKMYATDTTTQKIMVSWDLDNQECEENAYAVIPDELGYKATTLRGNVTAYVDAVVLSSTTIQATVYSGFGSAGNREKVVGLVALNFSIYNETTDSVVPVAPASETADGEYELTFAAQTTNDKLIVRVTGAQGYDVQDSNTVDAL